MVSATKVFFTIAAYSQLLAQHGRANGPTKLPKCKQLTWPTSRVSWEHVAPTQTRKASEQLTPQGLKSPPSNDFAHHFALQIPWQLTPSLGNVKHLQESMAIRRNHASQEVRVYPCRRRRRWRWRRRSQFSNSHGQGCGRASILPPWAGSNTSFHL